MRMSMPFEQVLSSCRGKTILAHIDLRLSVAKDSIRSVPTIICLYGHRRRLQEKTTLSAVLSGHDRAGASFQPACGNVATSLNRAFNRSQELKTSLAGYTPPGIANSQHEDALS